MFTYRNKRNSRREEFQDMEKGSIIDEAGSQKRQEGMECKCFGKKVPLLRFDWQIEIK